MIIVAICIFLVAWAGVAVYKSEGLPSAIGAAALTTVFASLVAGMILTGIADAYSDEKPNRVQVSSMDITDATEEVVYTVGVNGKNYVFSTGDELSAISAAANTRLVLFDRSCAPLWWSPFCFSEDPQLEIRGTLGS